jgi:hypothetical protein
MLATNAASIAFEFLKVFQKNATDLFLLYIRRKLNPLQ